MPNILDGICWEIPSLMASTIGLCQQHARSGFGPL